MTARTVALPWVRQADYDEVRRVMLDRDQWPATYEDWLANAEDEAAKSEREGNHVVRVMIEPYEFDVWCAANDMQKDCAGRNAFATENAGTVG